MLQALLNFSLNRVYLLYIILFLLVSMMIDIPEIIRNAQIRSLNRIRPSFDYIVRYSIGEDNMVEDSMVEDKLEAYAHYYDRVSRYVPNRADALGLKGYASYHLGEAATARQAYSRALEIKPDFFWFHHNLGVMAFKEGNLDGAVEHMKNALQCGFKDFIAYVMASQRIYLPLIMLKSGQPQKILFEEFKKGQRQAFQVIALSFFQQGQFQKAYFISQQAIKLGLDQHAFFEEIQSLSSSLLPHQSVPHSALKEPDITLFLY